MGVDGASPVHSLATQTFEEVGSRGWEKAHPSQLSLHWYHYRNFKQYWEKRAGCYKPSLLLSHLGFFYHSKAEIHTNTGSLPPRIAKLLAGDQRQPLGCRTWL